MGKKYIIELLDDCPSEFKGLMAFGLTQEKQISIELIPEESLRPYTEPHTAYWNEYKRGYETAKHECEDCRKIRADAEQELADKAYQRGYENGFVAGHLKAEKSGQSFYEDGYRCGLNDAWDAARKIWQSDIYLRIFKVPMRMDCFTKFSASECIEKIRQYEQIQEEQIQVGDEIEAIAGKAVVVYVDEHKVRYVYSNGVYAFECIGNVTKTGRHFPEIAEVLQKMKESE